MAGALITQERGRESDHQTTVEGYRSLTFMMLDDDVVAVSPSSVYRVLKQAGRLDRKWHKTSTKGTGFVQPLTAHQHWHITPADKLNGLRQIILDERDRKLEEARARRQQNRLAAREVA